MPSRRSATQVHPASSEREPKNPFRDNLCLDHQLPDQAGETAFEMKEILAVDDDIRSRDRTRSLPARHDRGFDAFDIESAIDPCACKKQVIETRPVRLQPPLRRSSGRSRAARPWIDVWLHDLIVDPIFALAIVGIEQHIPVESPVWTCQRPKHARFVLEPENRQFPGAVFGRLWHAGAARGLPVQSRLEYITEILERGWPGAYAAPILMIQYDCPVRPDVKRRRPRADRIVGQVPVANFLLARRPTHFRKSSGAPGLDRNGGHE